MPVQTSPPSLSDSFPSFMSVFGAGRALTYADSEGDRHHHLQRQGPAKSSRRFRRFVHRESVSSITSESTESSPTTTVSTFDSPLLADITPGSSPESPSAMPPSYPKFVPPSASVDSVRRSSADASLALPSTTTSKRADSPGRRARNLKNLSLRMPAPSPSRPAIATASIVETGSLHHHMSAPPSPTLLQTAKPARRRPANLTIRTPGLDRPFSSNILEVVPPTPGDSHQFLRHTESSPSLVSVFSPSFAPRGGMQLPRPMTHHGARRPSATSVDSFSTLPSVSDENSIAGSVVGGANASVGAGAGAGAAGGGGEILHELDEEDDHLDSRESSRKNERGYPDGPILIYDEGLYLYLEPTRAEAAAFDVVINVAKEVVNPFGGQKKSDTVVSTWRSVSSPALSEPPTAQSQTSFQSAMEYLDPKSPVVTNDHSSPTTPEYFHVGWDHNSEILEDLHSLCELIDSRLAQRKKVLIHCQLGASRSASLVIAYGLYKNRHLDFNAMYGIVKARSRWVGPNMSLIYQLTDFRLRLTRSSSSAEALSEMAEMTETPPSPPSSLPPKSMLLSPTRFSEDTESQRDSSIIFSHTSSTSSLSTPFFDPSAPPSAQSLGFSKSSSQKRSLSPRPLPLRQRMHPGRDFGEGNESEPGRPEATRSPSRRDTLESEAPPVPSPPLFSPRTTGFLAPSINQSRSLLGGLMAVRPAEPPLGFASQAADPRSPPAAMERLIMRNIDEFL
ncbi:hypothetical protein ASPZODRAFT_362402 [Penicilliopsis zonata CBS 506.65]|uniref:protein-tyrosine-phosphatase n=1 Tax=Penicilliopsis zonata CBS 506.65 TaxID=1073090 RepID=A0A1L9SWA7_9EURO|nr:hypothetical protein ASPZODRAFT_362402 [Penicilliopsis zonata CBS 506.65]OJJ51333.1 hypothetical protein ASPZODRAFT_362402 [Penicilliopsis zonata CBS 506.65]